MLAPRRLWDLALRPQGFAACAETPSGYGPALLGMLAWRVPFGILSGVATLIAARQALESVKRLEGPWAQALVMAVPEVAPEDLRTLLADLPPLNLSLQVWGWMLILVPLGLIGAWLHHSVWDHGCLWLLRGLRKEHPWAATLEAEALALQVGAVGALLGLLSFLPGLGMLLWPLVLLVELWFWGLRGAALAAFHGCSVWKGVAATLLHGALVVMVGCGLLTFLLAVAAVTP